MIFEVNILKDSNYEKDLVWRSGAQNCNKSADVFPEGVLLVALPIIKSGYKKAAFLSGAVSACRFGVLSTFLKYTIK